MADSARLQQIIWNLLKNAIKFTPARGAITVLSGNPNDASLSISVRDTGIGMDPELLARVFTPFEQGAHPFQPRQGGLGLGLAISKAIAEAHDAVLTATSPGDGQGATFNLMMKTVAPAQIEPPDCRLAGRDGKVPPLRILLVDDHADTCTAFANLLTRRGHNVTIAKDLTSALRVVGSESFDLLVSDLGLPDGSGLELMEKFRARAGLPGIAISGYGTHADVEASLAAGFVQHRVQPVTFDQLQTTIEQAITGAVAKGEEQSRKSSSVS